MVSGRVWILSGRADCPAFPLRFLGCEGGGWSAKGGARPATRRGRALSKARLDTYQSEFRATDNVEDLPPSLCIGGRVSGSGRTPVVRSAGTGGSWSNGLLVVRLVAGIGSGVADSWFGVSGSRSRMRHQRAAAWWSSGSGPAAAANRRRWVASTPARVRLVNFSSSSGRNGSAVALGTSMASSRRHCRSASVSGAASRLSSCCWKMRAARPSWGGPVGRRSLGSTWVAARHTCRSAISSARHAGRGTGVLW
jgi:hypothetical protein